MLQTNPQDRYDFDVLCVELKKLIELAGQQLPSHANDADVASMSTSLAKSVGMRQDSTETEIVSQSRTPSRQSLASDDANSIYLVEDFGEVLHELS